MSRVALEAINKAELLQCHNPETLADIADDAAVGLSLRVSGIFKRCVDLLDAGVTDVICTYRPLLEALGVDPLEDEEI